MRPRFPLRHVVTGLALSCLLDAAVARAQLLVDSRAPVPAADPYVIELESGPHVGPKVPLAGEDGLTEDDLFAGVITRDYPKKGKGRLVVVKGSQPPPAGEGKVRKVRVEVEAGLKIDRKAFAAFVMETLNDPRSWRYKSHERFARTDGRTDLRVVLASPATSAALCRPLKTDGVLSCRKGNAAYLTMYRWVHATPDYASDRTGYRRYLVNHEVGHALGRKHARCREAGWLAPVMLQQTISLAGCLPNSWPYPFALSEGPGNDAKAPDESVNPGGAAAPIVPDEMPSDRENGKNTGG